ncbi:hypothetical protein CSKR_108857 [Clonorchis sinensis]|uniref:Uncharacterized protein n=1 Tax=Clonorchis sinensis TaxID=79923 RepID=A0A419PP19_CLOSI|nr:hypothetical protein CSKR_108857 [Clonorchis sinensis]
MAWQLDTEWVDICPAFVNCEEMNIPSAKHDTHPTEFFVLLRFLTKFSRVIASGCNLDCLTIHVLGPAVYSCQCVVMCDVRTHLVKFTPSNQNNVGFSSLIFV